MGVARVLLLCLALPWYALASQASLLSGGNLVFNGDFEHAEDPLSGWRTTFDLPGESHYARNAEFVSIQRDPMRGNVLHIEVPPHLAKAGAKVFSRPIPFDPDAQYRFRVRARGRGTMARILVIGYRWNPRVTDRTEPSLETLRETYRFPVLHYTRGGTGGIGPPPTSWQWAELTLPRAELSDLAKRHLRQVEFVMVQLMAVERPGELLIDEVRLERLP